MYGKSSTARAELLVSGLYNFRSSHSTNSNARLAQGSIEETFVARFDKKTRNVREGAKQRRRSFPTTRASLAKSCGLRAIYQEASWQSGEVLLVSFDEGIRTALRDDKLTTEIFKNMGYHARQLLLDIYDNVWEGGRIPKDWGLSLIAPIYKKADKKDCNNYRGIIREEVEANSGTDIARCPKWV
ncbi:hypothetical protein Trydic_g3410 [Trypoxylus dichotomus]